MAERGERRDKTPFHNLDTFIFFNESVYLITEMRARRTENSIRFAIFLSFFGEKDDTNEIDFFLSIPHMDNSIGISSV